jgi:hypothetical protein
LALPWAVARDDFDASRLIELLKLLAMEFRAEFAGETSVWT